MCVIIILYKCFSTMLYFILQNASLSFKGVFSSNYTYSDDAEEGDYTNDIEYSMKRENSVFNDYILFPEIYESLILALSEILRKRL
jgi:hypothetical protein